MGARAGSTLGVLIKTIEIQTPAPASVRLGTCGYAYIAPVLGGSYLPSVGMLYFIALGVWAERREWYVHVDGQRKGAQGGGYLMSVKSSGGNGMWYVHVDGQRKGAQGGGYLMSVKSSGGNGMPSLLVGLGSGMKCTHLRLQSLASGLAGAGQEGGRWRDLES
jgi:hypothetical protein